MSLANQDRSLVAMLLAGAPPTQEEVQEVVTNFASEQDIEDAVGKALARVTNTLQSKKNCDKI